MRHSCGKYHYGDMSIIRPCCVEHAKDRKAAALKYALTDQHPAYREFEEAWNSLTTAEMRLVGDICRNFEIGTGFREFKPRKTHYLCVEVEDMAAYIGIDLWGCSADGKSLRVAPKGSAQPMGIMTRDEITNKFLCEFTVVPARPHSGYLEVHPRHAIAQQGRGNEKETAKAEN